MNKYEALTTAPGKFEVFSINQEYDVSVLEFEGRKVNFRTSSHDHCPREPPNLRGINLIGSEKQARGDKQRVGDQKAAHLNVSHH